MRPKNRKLRAGFLVAMMAACLTMACTNSDIDEVMNNTLPESTTADTTQHHARLHMAGTVQPFDAGTQTRADEWQWEDGSVIYLQYHVGSTLVRGHAVYSKSSNSWDAYYTGTISSNGQCEVYFFLGAPTNYQKSVTFTGDKAIYADTNCTYTMDGNILTIKASISPITSRIRFKGTNGTRINVTGMTWYAGYDATTNTLSTDTTLSLTVGSTGFTPYVYCNFTDATKRQLSISNSIDGDEMLFTKQFGTNVLQKGHSGYITIPTEDTNRGWTVSTPKNDLNFTVTGNGNTVKFTMIKVKPGTFQMGSDNGVSDEQPVHTVTLTKAYYMGETEVTQALWYAVMGQKPMNDGSAWSSSYGIGNDYPAYNISYTDCQSFISKLNTLTGQKFRMPTEAEWEFAARGGTKSKGYTYAGSNTIDDVAWYIDNAGSKTHAVKTKAANELGLYDMSGNVWEWCADWYGSYTSGAQTDPTGPTTGSHRVFRGGCCYINATNCRVARRSNDYPGGRGHNIGLRLAL